MCRVFESFGLFLLMKCLPAPTVLSLDGLKLYVIAMPGVCGGLFERPKRPGFNVKFFHLFDVLTELGPTFCLRPLWERPDCGRQFATRLSPSSFYAPYDAKL